MKRPLPFAALLGLLAPLCAPAETTNSTAGLDLPSFRIISERNIFDPNRSARSGTTAAAAPERRSTTESFSLLGTMSYAKGRFAFFDGSSSRYRTVLATSNQIAGYTITAISSTQVRLEATNTPPIELAVGAQMKRVDDGEWQKTGGPATKENGGANRSTNSTSTATSDDGADEVLKKLMQRREQELNK